MFDKLHENQRNLVKSNMKSIYGEEDLEKASLIDSAADFLEKGKKANLGEVREWSGRKYQKTTQGWKPAGKASSSKENGGAKEKFEQPDKGEVTKKLQEKVDSMSSDEASSLLDKLNSSKEKYGKLDSASQELKGMLEKKGKGSESKESGGKEKITMNNLDWGKSTEERNANLDKYESLKTDKEKEEFKRKLKSSSKQEASEGSEGFELENEINKVAKQYYELYHTEQEKYVKMGVAESTAKIEAKKRGKDFYVKPDINERGKFVVAHKVKPEEEGVSFKEFKNKNYNSLKNVANINIKHKKQ